MLFEHLVTHIELLPCHKPIRSFKKNINVICERITDFCSVFINEILFRNYFGCTEPSMKYIEIHAMFDSNDTNSDKNKHMCSSTYRPVTDSRLIPLTAYKDYLILLHDVM